MSGRSKTHRKLPMVRYLEAVRADTDRRRSTLDNLEPWVAAAVIRSSYDDCAHHVLAREGYNGNVIIAKADKAARRGYVDYGSSLNFPWITDKGRAYIAAHSTECDA